jgi:hypothetical protein
VLSLIKNTFQNVDALHKSGKLLNTMATQHRFETYRNSQAFRLLQKDFLNLFEYIEPVDAHLAVYSHRIYELQLRACTEFESLCKEVLGSKGLPAKNITDFAQLEVHYEWYTTLSQIEVGLHIWIPQPIYCRPFETWAGSKRTSPPWYQAYNRVKHNRRNRFADANLLNLVHAISGVFLILAPRSTQFDYLPYTGEEDTRTDIYIEQQRYYFQQYLDTPFAIRMKYPWEGI